MFTITKAEQTSIHNGICRLESAIEELDDVLSPRLISTLQKAKQDIENGFKNVRLQEAEWFNNQMDVFDQIRKDIGLHTTWSIFEVENIYDDSKIRGTTLVFEGWDADAEIPIKSNPINGEVSWMHLWMAADEAIKETNDHHIFIEKFIPMSDGRIRLIAGS
jgi:hypothetical protein